MVMIIFFIFVKCWPLMLFILAILVAVWEYFVRLLIMGVMVVSGGFGVERIMWVDCWNCWSCWMGLIVVIILSPHQFYLFNLHLPSNIYIG